MKTGDFVLIDYVGRVKESGEIFDVTKEEDAKKNGTYNPKVGYRPVSVVIDGDFVIKGLNDALKEMKVGEKRTVLINPENGFGERSAKMVRLIPLSSFKDQSVDPTPGAWVNVNGIRGKILSAGGGRIRVDFNHPLAGKSLEYDVEVRKEITGVPERVGAIAGFLTGIDSDKIEVKVNGKEADVSVKEERDVGGQTKKKIAELVVKWVPGVEKIRFVDEYGGK